MEAILYETHTFKDINGKDIELIGAHAYSVKSIGEDSVTIVNPWRSGEEIVLPKAEFAKKFQLEYLDLATTEDSNLLSETKPSYITEGDEKLRIFTDKNGRTTRIDTLDNKNETEKTRKIVYNESGKKIIEYETDYKNNKINTTQFGYDDDGNIVTKTKISTKPNSKSEEISNIYFENGKKKVEITQSVSGDSWQIVKNYYNEDGLLYKSEAGDNNSYTLTEVDFKNSKTTTTKYDYIKEEETIEEEYRDKDGNKTQTTYTVYAKDGSFICSNETFYNGDEQYKIVEKDNKHCCTQERDNENNKTTTIYEDYINNTTTKTVNDYNNKTRTVTVYYIDNNGKLTEGETTITSLDNIADFSKKIVRK